jgi:LysM repeat protein
VLPKNTVSSIENTLSRKKIIRSKETLYGIARQYGVTVEVNKLNPTLQKSGLKKGDKIRIPGTESNQNSAASFCGTNKRNSKKYCPEKKIVQKEEVNFY